MGDGPAAAGNPPRWMRSCSRRPHGQWNGIQYEDNAVYQATTGAGEQFILRVGAFDGHSVAEQRAELL